MSKGLAISKSDRPVSNHGDFPAIRSLGVDDLRECSALAVDRGWWPERGKWALLLAESEVWGIDAPDGQGLAGTVALTRWAPDRAGLGMMITSSRYGGRGLGRALMEHALSAAGDGTAVSLYATSSGRPLYDKLGFQPVRRSVAFRGMFRVSQKAEKSRKREARAGSASPAGSSGEIRAATEADIPAILTLDRATYGADRARMLTRLPGFAERIVVLEASEGIIGYAAAWRTEAYTVIGPLMAKDGEAAKRLVTELAGSATTQVRLDLDPDRPELPGWVQSCGLLATERTICMTHGDLTPRGVPEHLYTPISVAMA